MKPTKKTAFFISLLCLANAASSTVSHAQSSLTDIGVLPGGLNCEGIGINNNKTVIANCEDSQGRTFGIRKLSGQPIEKVPTISGKSCRSLNINNNDVVSGQCTGGSGEVRAVRWQSSGTRQVLEALPGLLGLLPDVAATGGPINFHGWIIGTSVNANGNARPVVWPGGQLTPELLPSVDPLASGGLNSINCEAVALNDTISTSNGPVVAGTCNITDNPDVMQSMAVFWRRNGLGNYAVNVLDTLIPTGNCDAISINNRGEIIGNCTDSNDESQAVFWPNGSTTPQSVASDIPSGTIRSSVAAISGDLVTGTFLTSNGFDHAFIWNPTSNAFLDIGVLPGGLSSTAVDLSGGAVPIIIGNMKFDDGTQRAFHWNGFGGLFDIGTLGGPNSMAVDISDNGNVIGTSQVPTGHQHVFIDPF
ncbi:hypothetical protein [Microbulbifer litoralis]|uniref:hypothetical protein n=1 Tax=Microbulbifer litoralis TaxID=2933965 RepID=UPI0020296090|nr:hypothetical protein [Microbulbifer sp. GX H0434]